MPSTSKSDRCDAARDRAARAHAILHRALALADDDRAAMVEAECRDDAALAALVRRLLVALDESAGFLETPALAPSAAPAIRTPDTVGDYLVIGVLGVGGMATVYEAEQDRPRRRVALKVMHHAPGNSEALLRFTLEAQTLARLHHPGIAQIYEAGAADVGGPVPTPFLAMELVPDAVTITKYADARRLSLRERLTLFVSVCDAVLHGHQMGVIHRDLKPENVLVRPDGQVKVIDFGIARHTAADMQAVTAATDGTRLMGTLNAMSPEQCADPSSVDVRADVYALGVILHELVTGRPPHDLARVSIPRAVRIICEEVPPLAGTLQPEARGDVEAIIARALAKDRDRRYAGADALALDIRRHLANRPIEARTATALEQARLFAQRNPPLVASLAATILLLVAGVLVSARFAYLAAQARNDALARQRELEVVVEFQESMLSGLDAWAMGDALRTRLASAVRSTHADDADTAWAALTENVSFTTLAVQTLDETVLQRYRASIDERFRDDPLLRARLLQRLASTMGALGLRASAEPVARTALALRQAGLGDDHPETLESALAVGSLLSQSGHAAEALDLLRETHDRAARTLGAEAHATLRAKSALAGAHRRAGDIDAATRLWSETLASQRRLLGANHPDTLRTLHNVGLVHAIAGRLDAAEACWREVIERRTEKLGEDHPDVRGSLGNLGMLLLDRGRVDEARSLIERALASDRRQLGNAHPSTLVSMAQLAALLQESGDLDGALALANECVVGRRHSLGPEHPDTLRATMFLATLRHQRGDSAEAERSLRDVLATQRRRLGEDHDSTLETLAALRDLLRERGRRDEALAISESLVALSERRATERPFEHGACLSTHGALRMGDRADVAALPYLTRGYELLERTVGRQHPRTREAAARLADWYDAADEREPGRTHRADAAAWRALAATPSS
ncbi:MAG: serine/threonine protein kinase [Phycisphaerae bacterium]|nr:serine/threonine protein kinase [Phycisphaerae bacterium]